MKINNEMFEVPLYTKCVYGTHPILKASSGRTTKSHPNPRSKAHRLKNKSPTSTLNYMITPDLPPEVSLPKLHSCPAMSDYSSRTGVRGKPTKPLANFTLKRCGVDLEKITETTVELARNGASARTYVEGPRLTNGEMGPALLCIG